MSGGFEVTGGRLVVTKDARTVATTGGTLLQFLTTEQVYTPNVVFPDANKGQLYQWDYSISRSPSDFNAIRFARSVVGAKPQEWASTVVLGAAPAGADLFIGRISLARTVAPSHTWLGQTISPFVPLGVAIGLAGSMLVEGAIGITRSLTIDVDGGNLVAKLEQSVGPEAGNFGAQGTHPPAVPSTSIPPNNVVQGSENVAVSGAGIPVWWTDTAPYYVNDNLVTTNATAAVLHAWNAQYGRSAQVSYSDPTDYSSTYALTVRGRFGRRS